MIFVYLCIALYIITITWCFWDSKKWGEDMVDVDNIPNEAYKNYGRAFIIPDREPMTNADRIRAMTDEELAVWVSALSSIQYHIGADPHHWLDWLKQESEEK